MLEIAANESSNESVTVDEQLVPFRGRCSFKQYMPSTKNKNLDVLFIYKLCC